MPTCRTPCAPYPPPGLFVDLTDQVKSVIITEWNELGAMQKVLTAAQVEFSSELVHVPMASVEVSTEDEEMNFVAIDKLEELDDVVNVEHNMDLANDPATDCRRRRRRLDERKLRGISQRGDMAQIGDRARRSLVESVQPYEKALEADWNEEWGARLSCWLAESPLKSQLHKCTAAFADHIAQEFISRFGNVAPQFQLEAAESGCEWVGQGRLGLPEFPEFGGLVPQMPKLLPWSVQKWNEIGSPQFGGSHEKHSAAPTRQEHPNQTIPAAAFGVGALSGVLIGAVAVLTVGLRSLRSRRMAIRATEPRSVAASIALQSF